VHHQSVDYTHAGFIPIPTLIKASGILPGVVLKLADIVKNMTKSEFTQRIVVYIVDHHPLESAEEGPFFRWLHVDNNFREQLEGIIGPYEPEKLTLMQDDEPGGEAWDQLLDDLLQERVQYLVTHLAPLSPAQRQQLIGVCAEVGTQLITPSDAGRNRLSDDSDRKI
jgi:hypothetical protein